MGYLENMDDATLDKLRSLCGQTLSYQGRNCTVIELLQNENSLVLQCSDQQRTIQANQFGEANRRVPDYHTLPLLIEHGVLNPVIAAWIKEAEAMP